MDQDTAVSAQDITGRSQVEEGLRRRNAQLDLLARVSQFLIFNRHSEQETLTTVFSEVAAAIGAEMYLHYQPYDAVSMRLCNWGGLTGDERTIFDTMRYGEQLCGRVAAWRKPIVIEDVAHTEHEGSEQVRAAGYGEYAGFPLLAGERLLGTIAFLTRTKTHFAGGDVLLVQTVCDQAAAMMDRARLMRELRDGEERLSLAREAAALGIHDYDIASGCIHWDARVRELWGVQPEEPITLETFWAGIHPEDRAGTEAALARGLDPDTGGRYQAEYRVVHRTTGEVRWITATGRVCFEDGRPRRLAGTVQDITARKQAEEKLRASEGRFRAIFNHQFQFSGLLTPGGQVIEISESAHRNAGTRPEDFAGKSFLDAPWWRELPGTRRQWRQQIEQALAGRGPARAEAPYVLADGTLRHALNTATAIRNDRGEVEFLLVEGVDITDRKLAEQQLRESDQRLRLALAACALGIWEWNVRTNAIRWDAQMFRIYGLPPTADGMVTYDTWKSAVLPEDLPGQERVLRATVAGGGESRRTFRIRTPEGEIRHIEAVETVRCNAAGQIEWVVGTNLDVTERQQAEATLRQSRKDLDRAQAVGQMGWWRLDTRQNVLTWSDENHRIFGVPQGTPLSYESFLATIHPGDRQEVDRRWQAAMRGEPYDFEHRIVADGQVKWVREKAYLEFDGEGHLLGGFGITQDITERKQSEAERQKFVSLADQSAEFIGMCDQEFKPFYVNQAGRQRVGLDSLEEACAVQVQDFFFPEDRAMITGEFFPKVLREGRAEVEVRFRHFKTGAALWMIYNVFQIKDAAGQLAGYATVSRDITARKQAEEALRDGEQRLAGIVGSAMDAIISVDDQQRLVLFNAAAEAMFGYPAAAILGSPLSRLIPERFRAAHGQHIHNFGATGVTSRQMGDLGELFGRRANGEEFPIEASISQGTTGGGKLYTVILRDITARKQAEAALQAHLREKDVLLHEIHHRVKNNLQIISSLVSLQSGPVTGEGRETLDNIRDQVRAMALVHEQLYQAGDFGRIEFAEYARKLLTQLWRAYGDAAAKAELKLDLGSVTLPITAAVPCGLVLNELAGNALKHAFRGRPEGGEVKVSLKGGPGGEVCLGVTDNGVGLPEGLDWRQSKSLGLRLVQMLAKQLGGTVESCRPEPGGTGFELRFQLAEDGLRTRQTVC